MKVLLLLAAIMLTACPAPPEAPSEREGPGTPLGSACTNLRSLRCPEGENTPGGKTCFEHLSASFAAIPIDCVVRARTVEDVRACGGPDTLRFRCRQTTP